MRNGDNLHKNTYEFNATLIKVDDTDASYIEIPFDVEKEFCKKRVKVKATFDGYEYDGILVRMQTDCHIIGVRKDIRKHLNKTFGDTIKVTIKERD